MRIYIYCEHNVNSLWAQSEYNGYLSAGGRLTGVETQFWRFFYVHGEVWKIISITISHYLQVTREASIHPYIGKWSGRPIFQQSIIYIL